MALTETRPQAAGAASRPDGGAPERTQVTAVEKVLGTGDHKTIGRIFIGASLLFVMSDLVMAALVNLQASAGGDFLEATIANRLSLNHPIGLLLCGALPLLLGLAIYLVPLQVGSPTIAFPRAAAASLWGWLLGTVLFVVALLVKGSYGGSSETMTRLGHVSVGLVVLSLLTGVLTVMVTVVSHRPAGMTLSRVPFFSFSMLVTGALWLATLPVLLADITLWQIRRPGPSDFEFGAYPAIEWVFHQPAIYIAAIPLLGIFADVCGSLSGQRQRNYTVIQSLIVAFGALSFGPWAQGDAARETLMWIVAAVAIALPVIAVLGGSIDTLRRGKLAVNGGLILTLSSILVLLLAVVAGALQGLATIGNKDQLFDLFAGGFTTLTPSTPSSGPGVTVGQFYLVIAAVVLGGLGATFHWGSRIWKGGLPSGAALALAPLGLLGGLAFGIGHVVIGIAQPGADGAKALAAVSGVGAIVLAVAVLGGLGAVVAVAAGKSNETSDPATGPEALGGTFEWLTASPPATGNFTIDLPTVESEYPVLDRNDQGAN